MDSTLRKRPSLKDIANAAGLTISTVSEILNGRKQNYSSAKTRENVQRIASELGYRPNFGYKIMLGKKTQTVAIVPVVKRVLADEHVKNLSILLMEKLKSIGYSSYLCTLTLDAADNIAKMQELISRGVEYFVLIGTPVGHEEMQELFISEGVNYVGVCSNYFKRRIELRVTDGVENILRFFLLEGRKNFKLMIGMHYAEGYQADRFVALQRLFPDMDKEELCQKYVIPIPSMGDEFDDFEAYACSEGYRLTNDALKKSPDIQALFYSNDYFAIGGVKCLAEKGLSIGKKIALAGCNNIHGIKFNPFPVSSIEHDIELIADIVCRKAAGSRAFQIRLESKAIIRTLKDGNKE